MRQADRFLTAQWNNLVMLNYAVDAALLGPFVPAGTELDSFQGRTYVSLIGFEFNDTRVYGIPIPFHRSFEEVNLRFYVRCRERRGVVFIRELVPKLAVSTVARLAFGENYARVPMSHRIGDEGEFRETEYAWGHRSKHCSMRIKARANRFLPQDGSLAQFITEHYWGYARQKDGGSLEYAVEHPQWLVCDAEEAEFSGDSTPYYGRGFAGLLKSKPDSAFLADGSAVTIFRGTRIE